MSTLDNILNKPGEKQQATAQPAQQQPQAPTATSTTQPTTAAQTAQPQAQPQPTATSAPAQATAQPAQQAPTPNDMGKAILSTQKTATDIDTTPIAAQPEKPLTYTEMYQRLNPFRPPTAEELEAEQKKEKREQLFASIGDGLSALSNLYFTTKGAPNMYDPSSSMSAKTKARWDKLRADRDAKMNAYISGIMSAKQADDAAEAAARQWERQLGLDNIKAAREQFQDQLAMLQEQRDEEMHDLNKQLTQNKIKQGEYETKIKEIESKYAEAEKKAELAAKRAAAEASRARAEKIRSGGGSSSSGKSGKGSSAKSKELSSAYRYWMSLTPAQKKQYRDWNNRISKRKGRQVTYMPDDENFILSVYRQRVAYLRNHGRADEIDNDESFNVNNYRRGGSRSNNVPPLN